MGLRRGTDGRLVVTQAPTVTLVMLSGGVDSTYTLAKLLQETDDELLVHHIHLVNRQGRDAIEAERCAAIVAWCQANFRPFAFSQSLVDHRGLRFHGYDMVTVGFEAGLVCHSYYLEQGRLPDRWTIGTCLEEGHDEKRFPHVQAGVAANCYPYSAPPFFLLPLVSKREELEFLPEPIRNLVWTCREPHYLDGEPLECGRCKTCLLMAKVRAELGVASLR